MTYTTADFDYALPSELIAQEPLIERSRSRMITIDATQQHFSDSDFQDIVDLVQPDDLIIFNDTRVFPARFSGRKITGGKVEGLVERIVDSQTAWVHLKCSKSPKVGSVLNLGADLSVVVEERDHDLFCLKIRGCQSPGWLAWLELHGDLPLPPYITRQPDQTDFQRYQTVFAQQVGAVAAPTAGLHFDNALLDQLQKKSIAMEYITLHVGAGTFQPVRVESLSEHVMHKEWITVSVSVCEAIESCRKRGGRVIAIGTTVLRALETAALSGQLAPFEGDTNLFITPGFKFNVVDSLLTNFHLPQSTLLMLVSAFGGYDLMRKAYRHAVDSQYRFFSYGDCMLVHRH
ncbi:MAG: tRNA preQ1(34) S-adenosylmethionine ribosyltransferase-isomerase QueA [Legionellales bacterium]|nr:tRNA preQ1(34) S-adenosylmethionine ribosyltransferase-isomerase QueA [Legionellales bacterium]HAG61734.1 tRNA preQ1(34) S-adenosylmethionine ribosyltransferase-isomerase QueA [Coxiellaceae bacterium]|tara:strand:- start:96 stop:1133 length:1038 start_codon:yes stop_codon:yes gene_type:complete